MGHTQQVTTFQDFGLDFPLFAAPVDEASEYIGASTCALCGLPKAHCFELGIGEDVIVACPVCQTLNALDADDQEDATCSACHHVVHFPDVEGSVHACSDCIQEGRAAFTQDTELGMVRWEDAQRSLTHGVPGNPHPDVDTSSNEDGWVQAHVPTAALLELVRTPNYLSWQGERWLFCHRQPMVYLGRWNQTDFQRAAPDGDGQTLFLQVVEDAAESLWENANSSSVGIYVFRCRTCGRHRAHHDCD